jgi:hypothetical protein
LLNLIDFGFTVMGNRFKPRIQIMDALVSRMVSVADHTVRFRHIACLVSAPREGFANRVRRQALLNLWVQRTRQLLA